MWVWGEPTEFRFLDSPPDDVIKSFAGFRVTLVIWVVVCLSFLDLTKQKYAKPAGEATTFDKAIISTNTNTATTNTFF